MLGTPPFDQENCEVSMPDYQRLAQMRESCVAKWMARMDNDRSCMEYFSGVASPTCTAPDLRAVCDFTAAKFTRGDAESLCTLLQGAHQEFWPLFWSRSFLEQK